MTLTLRQKTLVKESFAKVAPQADLAAELFYSRLFYYDPELQRLFKADLKQQGRKLMKTLQVAVSSLDNLDKLVPVLQELAIRHVHYGVTVDDYTPVGNALLYALKQGLGREFDRETRNAWVAVYRLVATVMREAAYANYNPNTYKNRKTYRH
ncbi:globin family protein [Vibrio sonorensis]|uniref:globin family protein n=1 Tax=Vibrio sonorensis TaxID=1004316 RepID=UPI0008D95F51|nr:globin family protein [Vibrio sonorensis]